MSRRGPLRAKCVVADTCVSSSRPTIVSAGARGQSAGSWIVARTEMVHPLLDGRPMPTPLATMFRQVATCRLMFGVIAFVPAIPDPTEPGLLPSLQLRGGAVAID